jgi:small subunit ribosomal protein S1
METNAVTPTESAQSFDLASIERKTKYTGTVVKTTLAGAVVDIGIGVPGVVHISQLQQTPTNRVEDVVQIGQAVEVWVKRVDPKRGRIELTMIEPLPLEWREIKKGISVTGKVTRLEKFGAFVDIGAERPGLIHISEMTHGYIKSPKDVVNEGDEVEVQVIDVNRRRKQIKLSMKALEEKPDPIKKTVQKPKNKQPESTEKEQPVPTAMEMALREAMERSKDTENVPEKEAKPKPTASDNEFEDILSRTLQNKVRTSN